MAISSSGWSTGSAGLGDRFGAYVAAGNLPFVVSFGEHGADEADDRAAVEEDADDVGAAADLLVEPLERVVISYQRRWMPAVTLDRLNAGGVRVGEYGATVRDEGVREQGRAGRSCWMGFELALVIWPPCDWPGCALRARIRRCRLPASCSDVNRLLEGVSMRRCIGLDVHRELAEVAIWENGVVRSAGQIATSSEALRLFAESFCELDEVRSRGDLQQACRCGLLERHVARVVVSVGVGSVSRTWRGGRAASSHPSRGRPARGRRHAPRSERGGKRFASPSSARMWQARIGPTP
jgi:hypothetical protein